MRRFISFPLIPSHTIISQSVYRVLIVLYSASYVQVRSTLVTSIILSGISPVWLRINL